MEGIVLRARLQDEVSSDPTGAPVIAVLARRADAGDVRLAPGTELHGRVVGSNETRIFVTFDFARTPGGERISLQGTARDEGGRVGIPGKKMFTQRTAGSIGVASASKVIQEAGRELAGPIGSVLGAGLEGAADAGADKTKRADRDEYVLIAQRGAGFAVYLQSSGS
ncbi:MAG TPA: hypothetical protein VFH51_00620 [Myxococcota bacterium]|nr:hypothetical protein [Myxococcota bacterium]